MEIAFDIFRKCLTVSKVSRLTCSALRKSTSNSVYAVYFYASLQYPRGLFCCLVLVTEPRYTARLKTVGKLDNFPSLDAMDTKF